MVRNDDRTDIMQGGRRVGYIDADDMLWLIGLDGYATQICEVADTAAAIEAIRKATIEGVNNHVG